MPIRGTETPSKICEAYVAQEGEDEYHTDSPHIVRLPRRLACSYGTRASFASGNVSRVILVSSIIGKRS
jgi:hypothetical protein